MNKEEKQKLLDIMDAAHEQCCDLWPKIIRLRRELLELEQLHKVYKKKYEDADRKIAEAERVKKVVVQKGFKKKSIFDELSKEEILELAEELGGEENEES